MSPCVQVSVRPSVRPSVCHSSVCLSVFLSISFQRCMQFFILIRSWSFLVYVHVLFSLLSNHSIPFFIFDSCLFILFCFSFLLLILIFFFIPFFIFDSRPFKNCILILFLHSISSFSIAICLFIAAFKIHFITPLKTAFFFSFFRLQSFFKLNFDIKTGFLLSSIRKR